MPSPDGEKRVLYRRAPRSLGRAGLEAFALRLENEVAGGRRFDCLVTDDRELQRLNAMFRGKDCATDVLSFPSGDGETLGEIAVSAQRAAAQAREYGHSVEDEICTLMLHGVLHLLGMDHENDRGRMRRAETAWRRKLGLASGLIERVGA